jgi:hypothetical protein
MYHVRSFVFVQPVYQHLMYLAGIICQPVFGILSVSPLK